MRRTILKFSRVKFPALRVDPSVTFKKFYIDNPVKRYFFVTAPGNAFKHLPHDLVLDPAHVQTDPLVKLSRLGDYEVVRRMRVRHQVPEKWKRRRVVTVVIVVFVHAALLLMLLLLLLLLVAL